MKSLFKMVYLVLFAGLLTPEAHGAVFTVGINGTYSTIQAAVDAAVSAGGDSFIKIRNSTFDEDVTIPASMTSGSLVLSGGWDIFFGSQELDPYSTVINPSFSVPANSPAVSVAHGGGSVQIENLTIMGGNASGDGGGLVVTVAGASELRLEHCIIRENTTTSGRGGGAFIQLTGNAAIEFYDCSIRQNHVTADLYDMHGGGLAVELLDDSSLVMSFCTIVDNEVVSGVTPHGVRGGGMDLLVRENAEATIMDSWFSNNRLGSLTGDKDGSEIAVILDESSGSPHFEARRNSFFSSSAILGSSLFFLYSSGSVAAEISDSCFAQGAGEGIDAFSSSLASLVFNNLTITGFSGAGIEVAGSAVTLVSLTNTILWDNGTDTPALPASSLTSGNLVGTDPLFVSPSRLDYSVQSGSPAIDIGDNAPAGGLGDRDLNRLDRVIGSAVDAGASEWGGIFADAFEVEDTRYWSDTQG